MKKWLFLAGLLFLASSSFAEMNKRDYQTWRSTEISGTPNNFLIATGAIVVADLTVTSGSVGSSTFQYRNSSSAAMGVSGSTSVAYDIDTTADYFPIGEDLGDGLVITKTGTSIIRLRWRWKIAVPVGQELRGLKEE